MLLFGTMLIGCGQSETTTSPNLTPAATVDVKVTFVGNSGFLITVGGQKVLIDALFDGFAPTVKTPLLNAEPPFDDVNLVLATHNHADHFSATLVRQYMQNNPNAIFMSTKQAVNQLTGLDDRVVVVEPVVGLPVNVQANGIGVEAIYLNHDYPTSVPSAVFNSGYVVSIGGVKLFHTGDIGDTEEARQYGLAEQNIDLAFIQHFHFLYDDVRSFLDEVVGANYLFPIHYQLTTPAFDADMIRGYFPDAIVFSAELESWSKSLPVHWRP